HRLVGRRSAPAQRNLRLARRIDRRPGRIVKLALTLDQVRAVRPGRDLDGHCVSPPWELSSATHDTTTNHARGAPRSAGPQPRDDLRRGPFIGAPRSAGPPAPRRPAARSVHRRASVGGAPAPRRPAARTARSTLWSMKEHGAILLVACYEL